MQKKNPLISLYDEISSKYDEKVKATNYIGPSWFIKNLSTLKNGNRDVLDLGCANGNNLIALISINPQISAIGIDISPSMIKEAEKKEIYSELFVNSLENPLNFEDDSFDAVLALGCLEFVKNIDGCLDEISRVMKDGAEFYASFQVHRPGDMKAPRQVTINNIIRYAHTQNEIKDKLDKRNLNIEIQEALIGFTNTKTGFECPYVMVRATKLAK